MMLGNDKKARTPTGLRVAPMSYVKLEEVARSLHPLLPTTPHSTKWRVDAWRVLEITLRRAGYEYRSEERALLNDCAAFTIPEQGLVVLREDVYDGLHTESVFSRSTVVHELSHIVLKHAVTLHRGATSSTHQFCEDSEWQANALTAALMMPIDACRAAENAHDLAQLCGTSVRAATYRIERLVKAGSIPPKQPSHGLFG
jgi:IrrE N-terminal-like domain